MKHYTQLLDEVNKIQDPGVRNFTVEAIQTVSHDNWSKRASSNHHPEDERGEYGNSIHTLRVIKLVRWLCEVCKKPQFDTDCCVSAAALHDVCRYGKFGLSNYTDPNHPEIAVAFLKKIKPETQQAIILDAVRHHMSQWGPSGYVPDISARDAVILADYLASQDDMGIPI